MGEDVVDVEQVPEDETDARAAKDKVRDHFPEKERKKAEEEKIVITPAALVEQTPPEEPEKPKKIKQDNKITPRTPPQRRRGPREDHSMIKLGKMLGETGGLDDENFDQVKGKYRPRDPREVRDERISPVPRRKFSGDDKDIKVQQQVSVMIQKANVRCDAKSFHHHTEHVVMIKLGRLQNAGNLTFEKYSRMKSSHRIEMSERVRFREIDSYDHEHDVFARLDNVVNNHPIIIKVTTSGAKPKVAEQDKVIQIAVAQLLTETHVPVGDKDFKFHMEQIVLIRVGNLMKAGTLTFHKYNSMKQQHIIEIKDALKNKEIDHYDWNTDIFTRLDFHIGIKTQREVDPTMIVVGPEDQEDESARKPKEKVRDEFAERTRAPKKDEKIGIKPADLTIEGPEDEEEDPDMRTAKDKVRDEFAERKKKAKEEEKIIIKPADLSGRGKKDAGDEEKAKKEKEAKEAAEKARKEKEAKEAEQKAKKEQEAKEAAEKAQKEKEVKEAAEKAKKEKEAKEAADKAKKEQEAKEAAAKAKKEKEAKEKAKKEQEAKEAAAKVKLEKEAKEAAEKAKKEKEEKEAAAKLQKEKEVKEEAAKVKLEKEAKEAA